MTEKTSFPFKTCVLEQLLFHLSILGQTVSEISDPNVSPKNLSLIADLGQLISFLSQTVQRQVETISEPQPVDTHWPFPSD